MSFNLMVFDPASAPRTKNEFEEWDDIQREWREGHSYDDPLVTSAALQNLFNEVRGLYPPLNGSLASSDEDFEKLDADVSKLTDYSISKNIIYMAFSWAVAEDARETVRKLSQKHQVGFFNPQSGEVLFPGYVTCGELRTNSNEIKQPRWEDIRFAIMQLENIDGEFLTIEKMNPNTLHYMQAIHWPKRRNTEGYYQVEIQPNDPDYTDAMPQFTLKTESIVEVLAIFLDWYNWGLAPNFSKWEKREVDLPYEGKTGLIGINKQVKKKNLVVFLGVIAILIAAFIIYVMIDIS